ncbi:MAG TPA: 50S ribosomal protein L21e [Candidatus Nanoarchaeia archaeon]|nr:50S ribosomal protein L21e [Candidatus Nanoarchaeia archaeon]
MVKRLGSRQRKTRHKFRATTREKGKISLAEYFKELQQGDLVNLAIHPNVFKGRFYRRFHGKSGIVNGKKGRCYGVQIKDGEKQKLLYVHPIHLRKQ